MKKLSSLIVIFCSIVLLASCDKSDRKVEGWVPVYANQDDMAVKNLSTLPPIADAGKIYIKGDYFYQVDNNKGIHVIDMSDRSNPKQEAFIQVVGAQEISIRANILYVNSINDLVSIDISDINSVKEIGRIKGAFNITEHDIKPPSSGYFECVDQSKGTVVRWEKATLTNPKCRY